ncbi:MAG: outer membrane lipoprotein carrier protein LolA [Bacteroidetes bacterium]|nr:outer membrane lipoprotein carrier protein LolA [Bacteroidota bacterium]MBK9673397.1 outer membrane lipoprotein carrier protein LolA [Bacteroidota bacterium]MBK9800593.1 outer membrane lipoprotein carrier protein LolA [Bacteroidota bacterium]MBP6411954.1 outer membrane lipoprotein carrier protein LolA [Bacteroidia bacterium]
MLKKITLVITAILLLSSAFTASAQIDEKAKKILDELSAKTKAFTSIIANFSYTIENKTEKTTETQEGKITIKGKKYRLEIANQIILNDTKFSYTILKDAKEIQKNVATNVGGKSSEDINPSNIFTMYENGFKYQFVKEEKQKSGAIHQVIKLFPTEAKKRNFHTVMLTIDKVKKQIVSIKILGKDGNDMTYNVKKFVTNSKVDDTVFAFNSKNYPGYEEIDLTQ